MKWSATRLRIECFATFWKAKKCDETRDKPIGLVFQAENENDNDDDFSSPVTNVITFIRKPASKTYKTHTEIPLSVFELENRAERGRSEVAAGEGRCPRLSDGDFVSINNNSNNDVDKMPQQPASVLLVCKINDSR